MPFALPTRVAAHGLAEVAAVNMIEPPEPSLGALYVVLGATGGSAPPCADAWQRHYQKLLAPRKRIVWFEESAHFPFVEEPERFTAEMCAVLADH